MDILVSIIVPVYNVEKYIEKCVLSIINQDERNIEIILVDDGSTDASGKIIDKLAIRDCRINVVHKINGGVSSARNEGLRIAKGEYVTFVDGDDWVEPDYVSYFLGLIKEYKCEVVMNKSNYSDNNRKSREVSYAISAEKAMEEIYLGGIFVAVWNKMYNLMFLKENSIWFDEKIWYGEGMLFNIDCLQFTDVVAIGEKNVYHQISNPESAMRKFNLNSNYCGIRSLDIQKKHWKKYNKEIEAAWDYHRYAFNRVIMNGISKSNTEIELRKEFDDCAEKLRKDWMIPLKVHIPIRKKISYLCYAIAPYQMAKRAKRKVQSKRGITQ